MEQSATAVRALHHLTFSSAPLGRLNRTLFGLVLPPHCGRLHRDAAGSLKWAFGGFPRRGVVSTVDRIRHGVSRTHRVRGSRRPEFCTVAHHCRGHVVLLPVGIVFRVEVVFLRKLAHVWKPRVLWRRLHTCVGSNAPGRRSRCYCRTCFQAVSLP